MFLVYAELSAETYLDFNEKQNKQAINRFHRNNETIKQTEIPKKYTDPEFQFKKFLKDSSQSHFSEIEHVSKIIMSKGSDVLKESFINLLRKYKDKSTFCAFELGKILLYDIESKPKERNIYSSKFYKTLLYGRKLNARQKKGLKIIEESAEKGLCKAKAIYFLIEYYSNTRNSEKEFYYLKKAASIGTVYEKLIYYFIGKKKFFMARKYFALYIQDLKNNIDDLESGEIEIADEGGKIEMEDRKKRGYYIQLIRQKIKKDESFFSDTIKKAENDNFINVQFKLRELSVLYDLTPSYDLL